MGPVCTIMVGRLDDWLKVLLEKEGHHRRSRMSRVGGCRRVQEGLSDLPGAGYRLRLLSAAYPQPHALERVHRWGRRRVASLRVAAEFNQSDVEVVPRIDDAVDKRILDQLLVHFEDFRRALPRRASLSKISTRSERPAIPCGSSSPQLPTSTP